MLTHPFWRNGTVRRFPLPPPRLTTFPSLTVTLLLRGRAVANPKANALPPPTRGHVYRAVTKFSRKSGSSQGETMSLWPSAAQGTCLDYPGGWGVDCSVLAPFKKVRFVLGGVTRTCNPGVFLLSQNIDRSHQDF